MVFGASSSGKGGRSPRGGLRRGVAEKGLVLVEAQGWTELQCSTQARDVGESAEWLLYVDMI